MRVQKGRVRKHPPFFLCVALIGVGLVACSSNTSLEDAITSPLLSSSTSSPLPLANPLANKAREVVAATGDARSSAVVPTGIGLTVPLSRFVSQKKVAWLECELPSCASVGTDWQIITDILGWDLKKFRSKSFEPAAAMRAALDWGANYIAITGSPIALYQEEFNEAVSKGVKVASCFATDKPQTIVAGIEGLLTQCGDTSFVRKSVEQLVPWTIVDSGADAHVVMVNIRDFPVLLEAENIFRDALKKRCSACTFDVIPTTVDDLGKGNVPQQVASYLQAQPQTNYVYFALADLSSGVSGALSLAGLAGNVSLIGGDFNKAALQEIVDGTHRAWSANPKALAAWVMAHAMVVDAAGDTFVEERVSASLPTFVVDNAVVAQQLLDDGGEWNGPANFETQFTRLWFAN